ncbi:MAG: glycoside hydrolase family 3 C-terminal domain-containing protein [Cyclobacteriaceae bacterium]|nr:glycoside hydrolase family 3 C-terminal domain-containing protein [Cyclobacteriaceae bacterium HetDA_MAG_MS6]
MKFAFAVTLVGLIACGGPRQQDKDLKYPYPFLNPELDANKRAKDIVSRLTTEEKLLQLFNNAPAIKRLGIPAYNWWNEALHGVARAGKATVFPQAIGLAATFNEPLVHRMASIISDEARAKHHHFAKHDVRSIYTGLTFWSPNINIFRDPRWGRGQETYGEDPFLTGRMAVNFINGLQGDDPHYLKSIATAKHYAVHSGPEYTRHIDNFFVNDRDLHETYLPAFQMAVEEADVQSVMCAYNRFRDQPCCGSSFLLEKTLRDQFGFDGYVVTDCGAISDFYQQGKHHIVERPSQALGWALAAGTDLNCEESEAFLIDNIHEALKIGMVNEADINKSLVRLFKARIALGLFDPEGQVPFSQIPIEVVGQESHLAAADELSRQSLVLLKNDGVLPLSEGEKIAVIGPNADNIDVLLGNYNGQPVNAVTPLEGIKTRFGDNKVSYAVGSPLVPDVYANKEVLPAKVLFHKEGGKLISGLAAKYNKGLDVRKEPSMQRIDEKIDFLWQQNPITNKLEGSFAVEWDGILKPESSGLYQFDMYILYGEYEIYVDDVLVEDRFISLTKDIEYKFKVVFRIEPFWWGNTISPDVHLRWVNKSKAYRAEAMATAQQAEVIIFCGGISPRLEGEEMQLNIDGFSHGDRTHIDLPTVQRDLLKELKKLGKPIVMVNFSGSAVALNWENENLGAIVQAFYPGEATGTAIAQLIAGDFSPSGRLPITFYRSVDDLPDFSDYTMENRTYRYFDGEVLFPFGYGLSYSAFEYSKFTYPQKVNTGDSIEITVDVSNRGTMAAGEVVQLYLRHESATAPVPRLSLKRFQYLFLKPGETKEIKFTLSPKDMSFIGSDYLRQVEAGNISYHIGGGQPESFAEMRQIALVGDTKVLSK